MISTEVASGIRRDAARRLEFEPSIAHQKVPHLRAFCVCGSRPVRSAASSVAAGWADLRGLRGVPRNLPTSADSEIPRRGRDAPGDSGDEAAREQAQHIAAAGETDQSAVGSGATRWPIRLSSVFVSVCSLRYA
jgi:hypothetical protein